LASDKIDILGEPAENNEKPQPFKWGILVSWNWSYMFSPLCCKTSVHYTCLVGHVVAPLFGALRYKPEGRGFGSRRCHWNFSLT